MFFGIKRGFVGQSQIVQENSVEEVEETLEFLVSQYGSFEGTLVYPIIVKEKMICSLK